MLIVLAGPTASGKSSLAMSLAKRLNGEIICADSRQVYQNLEIGTARPSLADQEKIPHHLFGVIDPRENFTVTDYRLAAERCIQELESAGKVPILVGGTGLYLRTLLYDYSIPAVSPLPAYREQLEQQEALHPGSAHQQLQMLDPLAAEKLHPNDSRRVIRALEVFKSTGESILKYQQRSHQLRDHCHYFALNLSKELLYARIQKRIAQMIEQGLIEEVQSLCQKFGSNLPLLKTLNYAEIIDYLQGSIDLDQAKEQMFIHTRQYAKRQRTWFRRDADICWFDIQVAEDLKQVPEQILNRLAQPFTQESCL